MFVLVEVVLTEIAQRINNRQFADAYMNLVFDFAYLNKNIFLEYCYIAVWVCTIIWEILRRRY